MYEDNKLHMLGIYIASLKNQINIQLQNSHLKMVGEWSVQ